MPFLQRVAFVLTVFGSLAFSTDIAFAQSNEVDQDFQQRLMGKWVVDVDETKKVWDKIDSIPKERINEALNMLKKATVEFREDGTMISGTPDRAGKVIQQQGKWENPQVDQEKSTITITTQTEASSRTKQVVIEVFEVDETTRLRFRQGATAVVFKVEAKESKPKDESKDKGKKGQ